MAQNIVDKKMDFQLGFKRADAFALDPSSVFFSKADADLYAAGGADSRGLGGTSYIGQIITVVENDVVTPYVIKADGTLSAIGGDVAADLSAITERLDGLSDLVVKSGEVRAATAEEIAADATLVADKLYIVLTIADVDSEDGKKDIFIPADSLVDVYTAGEGISIENNVVSVNTTTIATKGDITTVTGLANDAQTTATAAATLAEANATDITAIANILGVTRGDDNLLNTNDDVLTNGVISNLAAVIVDVGTPTIPAGADGEETPATGLHARIEALEAIEHPVASVNTTAVSGVSLALSDGELSLAGGVVTAGVTLSEKIVVTPANADAGVTEVAYAEGSTIQAALVSMNERINTNTASITAAVAGGVTAVAAGDGISVDTTNATQPSVSVKIADGSALGFNENTKGLDLFWIEA